MLSFSAKTTPHSRADSRTPPAPPGLPASGLVLIGTPATLPTLAAQIRSTYPEVVPAGCITLHAPDHNAGHTPHDADHLPPLLGSLDELIELHARLRFRFALVALPASLSTAARRIVAGLDRLDIPHRVVPSLADMLDAPTAPAPTRIRLVRPDDIDPAALIGRTHSGLDRRAVAAILAGKRVLITGAGGSIGSELARVAAGFGPERLILMERAENALFTIDHQLARRFPTVSRRAILHDVVDAEHTLRIVLEHRPHVVFHAAAHKHVPLMEDHPSHAVNNNLFGTKSIADAALAASAERFVLISTDKAVNPSSVMGATKRLAEMYVASLASASPTVPRPQSPVPSPVFSMVRFGNVLASACSVIPIWAQQLAEGGPVTITDPRMTRYFMTIPEAATLVAQAAALSSDPRSASLYVLDMGEPIRIFDLALRFIRLSGYEPNVLAQTLPPGTSTKDLPDISALNADAGAPRIDLRFTGSRPGEKLFEQLAYAAENLAPTAHPAIGCWTRGAGGAGPRFNAQAMIADLATVRHAGSVSDKCLVLDLLRRHVPEMTPQSPSPQSNAPAARG